jgi:hypothetical protein
LLTTISAPRRFALHTEKLLMAKWKPWTSRRELEEVRQAQLLLQERLDRERQNLQRERKERAQYEARIRDQQREQEAIYREAEARRVEDERQGRQRVEDQQRRAHEEEQRRQNEVVRQQVAASQRRLARMQELRSVSPDSLYILRELIRKRYALDVEIWSLRRVRRCDRQYVQEKMERADALLLEIRAMVRAWEGTESSWTRAEWSQAQAIQRRLLVDGKREWLINPPWNGQN